MSNICPKGHYSSDADYCSECGALMMARQSQSAANPAADRAANLALSARPAESSAGLSSTTTEVCPDCMMIRANGARFCEVCRYDFVSKSAFSGLVHTPSLAPVALDLPSADHVDVASEPLMELQQVPAPDVSASYAIDAAPMDALAPEPAVQTSADIPADMAVSALPTTGLSAATRSVPTAEAQSVSAGVLRLLLRVSVDASLYTDLDPAWPCPVQTAERIFHLDLAENTLGRQFEGNGIHPEIVVHDPGISRRHLKFIRDQDGRFSVLELGSSNGTRFNRVPLDVGVMTLIQPHDQLTLGMWTRITIEARD